MHKLLLWFICATFIVWILPLGVFLKPSQEKQACNGQRAICLCSHAPAKAAAKSKAAVYKTLGTDQKKVSGSSSASHHFLLTQKERPLTFGFTLYHRQQSSLYSLLVLRSIEHVPLI